MAAKPGYVYILASKRDGTLYVGVTSDLAGHIWGHKNDVLPGFTRRYGIKMLVWYASFDGISHAIDEEKRIKRWRRAWKIQLIKKDNPDWRDLYEDLSLI